MTKAGITGFGVYLPRRRLCRRTAAGHQSWLQPGLESTGRRTVANWDEDTVTMAVEAARNCVPSPVRGAVGAVTFASTTPVFLDRLNAGVIAGALDLPEDVEAADLCGARRAGMTALLNAIDAAEARGQDGLVIASERRAARAASPLELAIGDAAAALRVGPTGVLATLRARHTLTVDFVDRHRGAGTLVEYAWEDRWIREEGYGALTPRAVAGVLQRAGLAPQAVDILVAPCPFKGVMQKLAQEAGLGRAQVVSDLAEECGDLGAANALTLLAGALEIATPGQIILVCDFGQGCESAIFETAPAIGEFRPARTLRSQIADGVSELNYLRFLTMRKLIDWETRPRSEKDNRGSLSAMYRNRRALLGFVGGRDPDSGMVQFPPSRLKVGEEGMTTDTLVPYRLADKIGRVVSWSADRMTLTPDPPNYYGLIQFPEGGRLMMDFTDVLDAPVRTGMAMRMVFRIKEVETPRDFTRYFWKAQPVIDPGSEHA